MSDLMRPATSQPKPTKQGKMHLYPHSAGQKTKSSKPKGLKSARKRVSKVLPIDMSRH